MEIGPTVQLNVVEEVSLEAGPATTLLLLMEAQTALKTLSKLNLAITIPVQVIDFMKS